MNGIYSIFDINDNRNNIKWQTISHSCLKISLVCQQYCTKKLLSNSNRLCRRHFDNVTSLNTAIHASKYVQSPQYPFYSHRRARRSNIQEYAIDPWWSRIGVANMRPPTAAAPLYRGRDSGACLRGNLKNSFKCTNWDRETLYRYVREREHTLFHPSGSILANKSKADVGFAQG